MLYCTKNMADGEILYECADMRTAEVMADSFEKDEGLSVEIYIEYKDHDEKVTKEDLK